MPSVVESGYGILDLRRFRVWDLDGVMVFADFMCLGYYASGEKWFVNLLTLDACGLIPKHLTIYLLNATDVSEDKTSPSL